MDHHIVSTLRTSLQGNYSHAKCIIVYLYDFHLWADSFRKIISKVCSFIILSTKIHVAYTTRPCSWFCNMQTPRVSDLLTSNLLLNLWTVAETQMVFPGTYFKAFDSLTWCLHDNLSVWETRQRDNIIIWFMFAG